MMHRRILILMLLLLLATAVHGQEPNARVIYMWEKLNLRASPQSQSRVVAELATRTPLYVSARTRDNRWYNVQTLDGQSGWAASAYVNLTATTRADIPIFFEQTQSAAPATTNNSAATAPQETTPQEAAPQNPPAATGSGGRVTAQMLNVRSAPSMLGSLMTRLPFNTTVDLVGRSANNLWYQIPLADGRLAWVAAAYIDTNQAIESLPVVDVIEQNAPPPQPAAQADTTTAPPAPYFIMGANTWNIFASGQALGNHRDVFSKIGDSITVASVMYTPIGYGAYNLGGYGYLQPTITYFTRTPTRTGANSFNTVSLSAQNGWTTSAVLDPGRILNGACNFNESPIQCEYRLNRPSVALIMLGTNDVAFVPVDEFAHNLRLITEFSITQGVIPVLSTIPPRYGYDERVDFANQLIAQVASEFGTPLWDFGGLIRSLPNLGLSDDGVHPSMAPGGSANAANFTGDNVYFGYVARNLSALQVLDTIRREVLER